MEINKNRAKKLVKDKEKLSVKCDYIDPIKDNAEMREIILSIKDTMREHNLLALSAPQIGINKRIFCIKGRKTITTFVNPMLKKSTEMAFSREKDECFPDKEYIYPRSANIVVNYQTPMNDNQATNVKGYSAFVFQRMIDHLNGVLNSDIGLEIDEQWDKATDEEREEVLKAYVESLDMVTKKLNEDIEKDKNLSEQMKAIEFEHALIAGDVSLETTEVTPEEKEAIEAKLKAYEDYKNKENSKE